MYDIIEMREFKS